MSINRHNYEEFFLLYVDRELAPELRAEVEAFVQQNPDLASELEMLQQSVLLPEDITFEDKEELFRNNPGISSSNYEEYFLLAIDNELSEQGKEAVETFILQHPNLQEEYTQLQQTVLPAEDIVYPNKKELYRHEETKRVVPLVWFKMSVAAAILFLVAAAWLLVNDENIEQPAVANVQPQKIEKVEQQPVAPAASGHLAKAETTEKPATNESPAEVVKPVETTFAKNIQQRKDTRSTEIVVQKNEEKPIKLLPPTEEMMAAIIRKEPSEVNTTSNPQHANNQVVVVNNKPSTQAEQPIVHNAVYKDIEDEDETSKTIYIGAAEINKNKLKSILRKASTLFDKKEENTDGDNIIRIANFKLKGK
ncbi:hypothetical protein [Aridibaculum aurantiacum]|uniref:hypothetical protein n=1 Tax=Aridibaculum aurantiacum TaxID=2810307 RepID=UPI001A9605BE|nr:hypothetical protein [Aridibaculum aurantiacum]